MSINQKIVNDLINSKIEFVTTVPCKQLAGVIDEIDSAKSIYHIPSNKEDEGMGLCAGGIYGRQKKRHHHAKYGHWCDHQYVGDADPIL